MNWKNDDWKLAHESIYSTLSMAIPTLLCTDIAHSRPYRLHVYWVQYAEPATFYLYLYYFHATDDLLIDISCLLFHSNAFKFPTPSLSSTIGHQTWVMMRRSPSSMK